jgi:uncharacterized protein with GYD domain
MSAQEENNRKDTFLLLIKANAEAKKDPQKMASLIKEIDHAYMAQFKSISITLGHVALIGPYDFAILFTGTHESAMRLSLLISQKGGGMYETITMPAVQLDDFIGWAESM